MQMLNGLARGQDVCRVRETSSGLLDRIASMTVLREFRTNGAGHPCSPQPPAPPPGFRAKVAAVDRMKVSSSGLFKLLCTSLGFQIVWASLGGFVG